MRLRESASALVLAASCGGSPIESDTRSAADTSSSAAADGSSTTSIAEVDTSSTSSSTSANTSAPLDSSSGDTSGTSSSTALGESSSSDDGGVVCHPILHEVLYDPDSGDSDDAYEWIELFNPCDIDIELDQYELRSGGGGYGAPTPLSGQIVAGGCIVVGGPTSDASNASPTIDVAIDFEPDFENADSAADSIALFAAGDEPPRAVAIDRVVYGAENEFFPDARGRLDAPDIADVARGHTLARSDAAAGAPWVDSDQPSPNVCPNPPL